MKPFPKPYPGKAVIAVSVGAVILAATIVVLDDALAPLRAALSTHSRILLVPGFLWAACALLFLMRRS